jgi:hypothetical protein
VECSSLSDAPAVIVADAPPHRPRDWLGGQPYVTITYSTKIET